MRGAFGKPQGTVARVNIGQVILSVRTKDSHKASAIEAFRRAKFKFPGRQKVHMYVRCWFHGPCVGKQLLLSTDQVAPRKFSIIEYTGDPNLVVTIARVPFVPLDPFLLM